MKSIVAFVSTLAFVALAAPQPHHRHQHGHLKRMPSSTSEHGPTQTVNVFEYQGHEIGKADVMEGIKNGSMVYNPADPAPLPSTPSTPSTTSSLSTESPTPPVVESTAVAQSYVQPALPSSAAPAPAPAPEAPAPAEPAKPGAPVAPAPAPIYDTGSPAGYGSGSQSSDSSVSNDSTAELAVSAGVHKAFPDGQLPCSQFPDKYGALPLQWLGIGGWSGIQSPDSTTGGYGNIKTVSKDSCSGSDCCTEGAFCSYACPPGFQKSQWPTTQGNTGQSIGGIQCRNGKLHLTNKAMSRNLCMEGSTEVPIFIQNKMDKNSAVCRTDYPGTEGETIPLNAKPGSKQRLTCPAADNYYNWEGGHTSAQYYVNPSGVSVQDACQWGSSSKPWGNFAPLNLGVGYSGGSAWLSIFQNKPTTNQKLDFKVELVGNNGGYDNLSGKCKFENGQYCSGERYEKCNSDGAGCTVSVSHGTATFVFTS